MSAPRLVAPPVHLTAPTEQILAVLDEARERAGLEGDGPACLPVLAADLASQWAVEQDLAREGLDREAVDDAELTERARLTAEDAADRLGRALAGGGGDVAVCPLDVIEAAQAAFVALYEVGLVDRIEIVLWHCPRCRAVLGPEDIRTGSAEAEVSVLRVPLEGSDEAPEAALDVEHAALELLEAVSAVGVPPGLTLDGVPAAGRRATVPLGGQLVPVVEDPAFPAPSLVTPGHDPLHWRVARRHGLAAPVLPDDPARYAAREAAAERLTAEGWVVGNCYREEAVTACAHCGTVAGARLAPRWVLDGRLLVDAVAEHLADGHPDDPEEPADQTDGLGPGEGAGPIGEDDQPWCLGRELWLGVPLPVGWCTDCAKASVAVAATGSCGICFGELVPEPGVLDPLFATAAWVADTVRQDGGIFVGGGRRWLGIALALARRVEAAPLSVVGPLVPGVRV